MFSLFISCSIANTEFSCVKAHIRAAWIQHLCVPTSTFGQTLSLLSMWGLTVVGPEFVSSLQQVMALNFYA